MALRALPFLLCGFLAVPAFGQEKKESVAIPDSAVKFDLVGLPGGKTKIGTPDGKSERDVDLKPFWNGAREVTWEEDPPN